MPISTAEFDAGRPDPAADTPDTPPVGDYGAERFLVFVSLDVSLPPTSRESRTDHRVARS